MEKPESLNTQELLQRRDDMWSVVMAAFLGGGLVTGAVIWKVQDKSSKADEIIEALSSLETQFEQAQAKAVTNLTEPDLLKVPCSEEYMEKHGDLLCREMFCRMNRQGGGQNSGGGPGATAQDCSSISGASVNLIKVETCMPYWTDKAGSDQNSQFWRCMSAFGQTP